MKKTWKLFVLSLLFSMATLSAEKEIVSSKATVLFTENGVDQYLYSNNYELTLDRNKTVSLTKESSIKESLWLVFKNVSKSSVGMGDFIKYSLELENKGLSKISETSLMIELPSGFRYAKNSYRLDNNISKKIEVSSNKLILKLDTLDKGKRCNVEFVLQVGVATATKATVVATATAQGVDSNRVESTVSIQNRELMRGFSTIVGKVSVSDIPIKDVRIYMEDGTFTLTDGEGKYNFVGIKEGTHVVQLDKESLSSAYEAKSCEKNVAFASSNVSQFVKTFSGTLHRTNFCLKVKESYQEDIQLFPKFSSLDDVLNEEAKEVINKALLDVDPLNVDALIIEGHTDSQKIRSGNRFKNNKELALARAKSVKKYISSYLNISLDKIHILSFGATKPVSSNRTTDGRAKNRRVELHIIKQYTESDAPKEKKFIINKKPVEMPDYDENWLTEQNDEVKFMWPTRKFVPSTSAVNLAVKHKGEYKATYFVNGKAVDVVHFHKKIMDELGKAVTIYKGVHIQEGDNTLVCLIKDENEKIVNRLTQMIHYSTMPVRAEVVKSYSNLVADGKEIPVIAVKFFDKDGYPVRSDIIGKFKISQPYRGYRRLDALGQNPLSKSTTGEDYVIVDDGMAYIRLEATTKAGEATLSLPFSDRTEVLKVWLKPKVRDWIVVGFVEGSVGYNTIAKNMEVSTVDSDAQVSLFAKGKVLGSYLMTLSYNTKTTKKPLLDIIDPARYYTIYGDSSVRGVDAPSQKKLYFKLEKENFYAMFGDFVTGLNDMELSKYERTLNGVKAEFNGKDVQMELFGSDSDQSFVKDEIEADGTSGLYYLSNKKIIINSEKITLETRDRFHLDRVIKSETVERDIDYTVDYFKGTLYFKKPIFSRDKNFNPVYIVVKYEIQSKLESLTAGARVSVNMFNQRVQLSTTYIQEYLGEERNQLASIDMRVNVGEKGKLELEYAENTRTKTEGHKDAIRAEYEHNGKSFYTKVFYKKIDKDFGLQQQSIEALDLESIGFESNYNLGTTLDVKTKAYREKKITTGETLDVLESTLLSTKDTLQLEGGVRYINEHKKATIPTKQLIAGINKSFFENKLTLRAKREETVSTNNSEAYPTRTLIGAEYQLSENHALFLEEELSEGLSKERIQKVGIATKPWKGGTIQSSIGEKQMKDGDRLFSLLGLQQTMELNDFINIDLGLDRVETIDGDKSDDFTSYSTSINYHKDRLSSNLKVEYKQTEEDESIGLALALATELDMGLELVTTAQYFKSNKEEELLYSDLSLLHRPFESDYTLLDKFHFVDEKSKGLKSRKFVNDFNFNYKINSLFELSLYHGIKYVIESIDNDKYSGVTQMLGVRATYDINEKFDVMVYSNIINGQSTLNQQEFNHGLVVGWNAYENVDLLLGYNLEGFEDFDFNSGTKTKEGVYFGFRMKFE
jgi:outer membrane protein OmpA-like peptidoglycan-associated protein